MRSLIASLAIVASSNVCLAQFDVDKLLSGDLAADDDRFGTGLDIDADRLIVGMPWDDDVHANAGAALIFERDGAWSLVSKLTIDEAEVLDNIGYAVAIEGDVAIVGHPYFSGKGLYSGAAYVFERDEAGEWSQAQRLEASDGAAVDQFGYSVEIEDGVVYVAAPYDGPLGNDVGAIYVFERDGDQWVEVDKLAGEIQNGQFGEVMDVDANVLAVGSPTGEYAITHVKVYERVDGDLVYQGSADAAEPALYSGFGNAIALDATTMVVGAPDFGGTPFELAGAAYIFERDEQGVWQEVEMHEGGGFIDYAASVAVDGDRALVGSIGAFVGGFTGKVDVFERTAPGIWTQVDPLLSGEANDGFGSSVAMHGARAVVGAPFDNELAGEAGAVYVYAESCTADVNGDGAVDILDFVAFQQLWIDQDAVADCDANGIFNVLDFVCFQIEFSACNS